MNAGDTFLITDKNLDEHPWVIISDTAIDDKQVVVVNFTTSHPSKESFCLVQSGDHPFIRHKTCISYLHARITSVAGCSITGTQEPSCHKSLFPRLY